MLTPSISRLESLSGGHMETFRRAVESGDPEAIVRTLAEDVVFQSPIVFRAYRGRAEVGTILRAVVRVLKEFRYDEAFERDGHGVLVFTAKVGDREIQGIDLLEVDAAGLVQKLTVFVRPLSAAHALAAAMQAELGGAS
jgi:hypothetical protein